jgi:DNA repair photolyase
MDDYLKGRGAQINTKNPFLSRELVQEQIEGLDEPLRKEKVVSQFFYDHAKKIVNTIDSPDLSYSYSINAYQGCEHGCAYCYARNSHTYWGFSAGLDFETKIMVKKNAPQLLEKHFQKKSWKPEPIMLSGNTDCYQPVEQKMELTRKLLKVFLKYGNPVGIVTKNDLILRDLDVLEELATKNLVRVVVSITTLDEKLRRVMEPRTATSTNRLKVIEKLSAKNVPVGVLVAPIIPGLNNHEIPRIVQATGSAGALMAGYTVVRLNGDIALLFRNWLEKNFPDRVQKVWSQIEQLHGGKVNDSMWGRRMKGEGVLADSIRQIFKASLKKHMPGRRFPEYDLSHFSSSGSLRLF